MEITKVDRHQMTVTYEGGKAMFLTKQERLAIKATYDFWGANKRTPQRFRNKLTDDFLTEWQSKVNVMKPIMMHPDTKRKDFKRSRSIADIMADFILDISQVDERKQEYPIENAEKAFRENLKRQKLERSIVFQSESDRDSGRLGEDYRTPPYSVEEYTFNTRNPIEDRLFKEDKAETVEALSEKIFHVKKFREFYVATYSDEMPEKGRNRKDVRVAIKKLDLTKVKMCRTCGGSFYAHYRGRIDCDIQQDNIKNLSTCERKAHRNRNSTQKYSIM